MRYYLLVDRRAEGAFEVPELLARPDFDGASTVCEVGATSADAWRRADEFAELAEALQQRDAAAEPAPDAPAEAAPEGEAQEWVEPEAAEGPAAADAEAPAEAVAEGEAAAEASGAAPPVEAAAPAPEFAVEPDASAAAVDDNPARRLVMIADDDAEFRTLMSAAIKKEGFRVVTAEDGKDAAGKLEPFTPDILITDLKMPRMGGLELIRALQSLGHAEVPIIVVDGTTIDATTIATMRMEGKIVDFIKKPVSVSTVLNLIHDSLGTRRLSPRQKAELENKDGWSS